MNFRKKMTEFIIALFYSLIFSQQFIETKLIKINLLQFLQNDHNVYFNK